jgi:hypothetical protein
MTCLLIEFVLIIIIFLLKLLRKLPDDIIFKLEEPPLLFIVFEKHSSFSQLARHVVRVNVNLDFELLC